MIPSTACHFCVVASLKHQISALPVAVALTGCPTLSSESQRPPLVYMLTLHDTMYYCASLHFFGVELRKPRPPEVALSTATAGVSDLRDH